ncbi:MAG: hypothetical protein V2A58_17620 [Planctomycetota bacterium]
MSNGQSARTAVIWLSVMFLAAAIITILAFLTAVSPADRHRPFYIWMAVACAAEFVLFAWTANWSVSRRSPGTITGATRIMIHVLIVIWFLVTLVTAFVATHPRQEQSYYNDRIAIAYAAFTLLFFFGSYLLYAKDLVIQREDRIAQADRLELRAHVADVEEVAQSLRRIADRNPDSAVAIDRLLKRLDAVRTGLDFAPPGKIGTWEEDGARHVDEINARIIGELQELTKSVSDLESGAGSFADGSARLDAVVGRIESSLRRRQHQLL